MLNACRCVQGKDRKDTVKKIVSVLGHPSSEVSRLAALKHQTMPLSACSWPTFLARINEMSLWCTVSLKHRRTDTHEEACDAQGHSCFTSDRERVLL